MSDLEPCPFCGGTTGRFATDAGSSSYVGKWGWWECDCGARAEDVRTGYDADGWQNFAIAAWNRRAPSAEETRLRAEVASLRATLGQQPAAEGAEPIGCPLPGACGAVRAHAAAFRAGAAEMRERAAGVAEAFPARTHGALATAPYAAAEQAAEEVAAAIRALPAGGSGWRPIETAPRDGTSILCYAPGTPDRAAVRRTDYWWLEQNAFAHMRPSQPYTRWQPLPAAPEGFGT